MQTINIFPKTLRFFTISFLTKLYDVSVKIFETAQLLSRAKNSDYGPYNYVVVGAIILIINVISKFG
jgi:hypothetical protein